MERKGGRGKMVTAVKPIRPTEVQFDNQKDLDRFMNNEVFSKKAPSKKMNELMKRHLEQRKK